jgi:hypothetical protein
MTTLATTDGAMEAVKQILFQTYGGRYADPKVEACLAMVINRCAEWDPSNVMAALDGHISNSTGDPPPGNFLPTFAELQKQVQRIYQEQLHQRKQEHVRQYHEEGTGAEAMHELFGRAHEEVEYHEKSKRVMLSTLKGSLGLNFLHEDLPTQRLHCAAYQAVIREYQRVETEEGRHLGTSEAIEIATAVLDSSGVAAAEYKRGGGKPYSGGEPWQDNPFPQRNAQATH